MTRLACRLGPDQLCCAWPASWLPSAIWPLGTNTLQLMQLARVSYPGGGGGAANLMQQLRSAGGGTRRTRQRRQLQLDTRCGMHVCG